MNDQKFVVLDIGGTHFRIGLYRQSRNELLNVRRFPTPNFLSLPGYSVDQLQIVLVDTILRNILSYLKRQRGNVAGIGISFAGPVNPNGTVIEAPTIWGKKGKPLDLARILTERLGMPVRVINDITAAAWRYSEWYGNAFCVITVSSGIGNKVFYNNRVLVNERGYGGEIGHFCCDRSDDAWDCDCGQGRGHLGALASGRGIVKLARKIGNQNRDEYFQSRLGQVTGNDLDQITTYHIVAAIHHGDPFTLAILRQSQRYLAGVISCIYNAIGIEKYIIIGGFAVAVGAAYVDFLKEELKKVGCFGMDEQDIEKMVELGEPDDAHGLVGVGRYMAFEVLQGVTA